MTINTYLGTERVKVQTLRFRLRKGYKIGMIDYDRITQNL